MTRAATSCGASPRQDLAIFGAEPPMMLRPTSQGGRPGGVCRRCQAWQTRCMELEAQLAALRLAGARRPQPTAGKRSCTGSKDSSTFADARAEAPHTLKPERMDVAVTASPDVSVTACQTNPDLEGCIAESKASRTVCELGVQASPCGLAIVAMKAVQTTRPEVWPPHLRSQATQTRQWSWPKRDVACSAAIEDEEQGQQRLLLLQKIDTLLEESGRWQAEATEAQRENGRLQVVVQSILCERKAPNAISEPGPYQLQQYHAKPSWLIKQRWQTPAASERPSSARGPTAHDEKDRPPTADAPVSQGRQMLSKTWIEFERGCDAADKSEDFEAAQRRSSSSTSEAMEKLPSLPAALPSPVAAPAGREEGVRSEPCSARSVKLRPSSGCAAPRRSNNPM